MHLPPRGRRLRETQAGVSVRPTFPTLFWPLALLVSGIGIAYGAAALEHRAEHQRQRDVVRTELEPIRGALSRELFGAIHLTEGIASLIAVQGGISEEKFVAFTSQLFRRSDSIRNVAVAPDNVVSLVFPRHGNEESIGLRYRESPDQWPSVKRMMDEGRMIVAGPVHLVQGGVGVIGRTPIYLRASDDDNASGVRYWGLTSTVLDFDKLLARTPLEKTRETLDVALRGVDGVGAQGAVFLGVAQVFSASPVIVDVPLPSGTWQLAAVPRSGWPGFFALTSRYFWSGSALSAVLAALLLRLLQSAAEKQREVVQRRRVETALRRSNRALRLFSHVKSAIVQATREDTLLSEVCRISVESAGYRMACIVRRDGTDGEQLARLAFAFADGAEAHELAADHPVFLRISEAIRARLPQATTHAVRYSLADRDVGATVSIPLPLDDDLRTVLVIGAAEVEAFADTEVELLEDLGSALSYGVKAIRAQEARQLAMAELEQARQTLEARVARRTNELRIARDAAESADRLKSAFLAAMSHELRTPLNSIIGFSGILLQGMAGPLNAEQNKQLGMVRGSARHLLSLINDVLDLSKIEAGQLQVVMEPFDLRAAIENTVETVRPQSDKKGITLEVDIDGDVRLVKSDARRVEQVLLNLLSNAIKFTAEGHVRLRASTSDGSVTIHVTDTGIGIKPEELGKLFKPFSQVDSGTNRTHEGTGLGLSICKRLVEKLGGRIWVESEWGKGSTFGFELPVEHTMAEADSTGQPLAGS